MAMSVLASQTRALYKIDCQFNGPEDFRIENPDTALHLFRIAQEAIQNAIRHGSARKINLSLTPTKKHLALKISNNGKPFTKTSGRLTEIGNGLGLKLIAYRSDLIGGSWKISNLPKGSGVCLQITTPLNREDNK